MQRAGCCSECVHFGLREWFGGCKKLFNLGGRARSSPRGPAGFPDPD